MFCPNCGANLPDSAQFCGFCGIQISSKPARTSPLSTLTKKQKTAIICGIAAVIVAVFLIFFFACGGCDSMAQKGLVHDYINATEKGNAKKVVDCYYSAVLTEEGYETGKYEEFLNDYDSYYEEYAGKEVKKYDVTVTTLEEMLKPYMSLYSAYGYDVNDILDEAYDAFEDEYDARLSDIAIAVVNVDFKSGYDTTLSVVLVKIDGSWYIAGLEEGSLDLF